MGLMFSILCACSTVNVFIKDLKKRDRQYTGLLSTACACYEQHYLEISFSYGTSLVAKALRNNSHRSYTLGFGFGRSTDNATLIIPVKLPDYSHFNFCYPEIMPAY